MKIPAAFEGAFAKALTDNAVLTDMPRLRCWHILEGDARWTPTADRAFPLVDIRCNLPTTGDDGCTQVATVRVLVATNANADQNHAELDRYMSAVEDVTSALYSQFRAEAALAERNSFDGYLADAHPDVAQAISIGGFEIGDSLHPYEEGGINFEGRDFIVHFSRGDY